MARRSRRATARPQAILPLRGKILNVANASSAKLSQNQLISDLILALGCGTGSAYRDEDLRYDRIIVMTDADVDGAHIASLLITFFYQEMPQLIEDGHLFLAVPPLYKLTAGDRFRIRPRRQAPRPARGETVQGQEGDDHPLQGPWRNERHRSSRRRPWIRKKRTLLRVEIGDGEKSELAEAVNALMGSKPEARFRFIQERAEFAKADALDI